MGRWFFWEIITAAILITMSEWKRLLKQRGKDRIVFIALLVVAAAMSLLNLPETAGPTTWLRYLYGPLRIWAEP